MAKVHFDTIDIPYAKYLDDVMYKEGYSLRDALVLDMWQSGINIDNVYDCVEYLEDKTENLDIVQYLMNVYTKIEPDVLLK